MHQPGGSGVAARPDEIDRDHGPARTLRFPADPAHARSAEFGLGDLKSGGLRAVRVRVSPPASHENAANERVAASRLTTLACPNSRGDSESGSASRIRARFARREGVIGRGEPRRAKVSQGQPRSIRRRGSSTSMVREGVDGSSPSEGSRKAPQGGAFLWMRACTSCRTLGCGAHSGASRISVATSGVLGLQQAPGDVGLQPTKRSRAL